MLGTMLRERTVCADLTASWSANEAANTIKRLDIPRPNAPVSEYMLTVVNPSTQTDLTIRLFAAETSLNNDTRLCLVRTIGIPKAASTLTAWAASTAYSLNDSRRPLNVVNGHKYKITTAGTSGASQPAWPVSSGATVSDGTAVWTEDGLDLTGAHAVSLYLHGVFDGSDMVVLLSNDTGGTLTAFDAVLRLREVI